MDEPIAVVEADAQSSRTICALLEREKYQTIALDSLGNLEKSLEGGKWLAVILDLDGLPVDNRFITQLRKQNPDLPIIGLSSRPVHPELKESIGTHICACLSNPPDPEELVFCVRSFVNR